MKARCRCNSPQAAGRTHEQMRLHAQPRHIDDEASHAIRSPWATAARQPKRERHPECERSSTARSPHGTRRRRWNNAVKQSPRGANAIERVMHPRPTKADALHLTSSSKQQKNAVRWGPSDRRRGPRRTRRPRRSGLRRPHAPRKEKGKDSGCSRERPRT